MIELTPDLHIKGYGRFLEYFSKKENFKDRLQELAILQKKLGDLYLLKLGKDQKVTGLEKKELSDSIEELFSFALLLRKLDFPPPDGPLKIQSQNRLFYVLLNFPQDPSWEITGHMRSDYVIKARVFRELFNGVVSVSIKDFLGKFGRALADKKITEEESKEIGESLDKILLDLIELYIFVEAMMQFQ